MGKVEGAVRILERFMSLYRINPATRRRDPRGRRYLRHAARSIRNSPGHKVNKHGRTGVRR